MPALPEYFLRRNESISRSAYWSDTIYTGVGAANRIEGAIMIGTEVGQVYPNYVLPSLIDGKPLALSKFRGKKIILHQFASW